MGGDDTNRYGSVPWLLQRISAVFLSVLLGIHFWVGHYADFGAPVTFAGVHMRLQNALFIILDSILLISVVFHGLNGIRNIILDYSALLSHNRSVSLILFIIGTATVIFGIYALYPLITGGG